MKEPQRWMLLHAQSEGWIHVAVTLGCQITTAVCKDCYCILRAVAWIVTFCCLLSGNVCV